MTGNDSNQSPRMYFVLLGITYLVVVEKYPARGRVVVDAVVMPGVLSRVIRQIKELIN